MRQTSFADFHCSLARSLEVMGDWWSPLILRDVYLGVDRFDEIVENLGISRNLLTRRLADLTADGLLERRLYSRRPPRHRYALTDAGAELLPILAALAAWGDRHQTPPGGPPLRFVHDGHRCEPVVTCSTCGAGVTARELEPRPGPGGRDAPGTAVIARRLLERSAERDV